MFIADLAVFWEWTDKLGWREINVSAGYYSVSIKGFRCISNKIIIDYGYEITLEQKKNLPDITASLDQDMQVLYLPGNGV